MSVFVVSLMVKAGRVRTWPSMKQQEGNGILFRDFLEDEVNFNPFDSSFEWPVSAIFVQLT